MYGTAQDVAAVWDTYTALADAAHTPGDERDLGNRRVDALVDLTQSVLDHGALPYDIEPAPPAADGSAVARASASRRGTRCSSGARGFRVMGAWRLAS